MRDRLDDDGFTVIDDIFDPAEIETLAERLERAYRSYDEQLASGAAANADGISRPQKIAFAPDIARNDRVLAQFCRRPELLTIASAALGPDVDLYWDQLVVKAPETARDFPWHQDDAYGRVDPSPYLTLWIPLDDATTENGCISVLPGSHKRGFVPHARRTEGLYCHDDDDPDQRVQVPVRAGAVLAFWSLTVHKSGPNLSGDLRRANIVQYTTAGTRDASTGELVDAAAVLRARTPVGRR